MFKKIKYRSAQLIRWAKMFSGNSYYHVPQNIGQSFEANELKGYFNDMTGKTKWEGPVNDCGIPINILSNGKENIFPIMVTQKALGHWDMWIMYQNEADKTAFFNLCQWLLDNQDTKGGWDTWSIPIGETVLIYSSMTQGEAMSALVRAYSVTKEQRYLDAAKDAFKLFKTPIAEGGVTDFSNNNIVFEEFPSQKNSVLNGWIFSIFGLYDYLLVAEDIEMKTMLDKSVETLSKTFSRYHLSYWSLYDLTGRMTSPFYHNLHIGQVKALSLSFNYPIFHEHYVSWSRYQKNIFFKTKALAVKAIQKFKEPVQITIE